jgi:hypothetical protein
MIQTFKQAFLYASLITAALISLKLFDRIEWEWRLVLSPVGFVFTLGLSVATVRYCANLGEYLDEKQDEPKNRLDAKGQVRISGRSDEAGRTIESPTEN